MTQADEPGPQVLQNVIAVNGFAYGVIGADIHVFANGLPLYLLANWRPAPAGSPDWLRELPSRMLNARRAVVPFTGRESDLAQLREWRDGGPRLAARWLHGPGGQGKSRLADRLAADSETAGWKVIAAFHGPDADTPKPGSQDMQLTDAAGLLVIVDYADRWRLTNMTWLLKNALLHHDKVTTRVLMVARDADTWPAIRAILDTYQAGTSGHQLPGLGPEPGVRSSMFTTARDSFAVIYGMADPAGIGPPGSLDGPEFGLTLAVHMAALAAVDAQATGQRPPAEPGALSMYLLDRERLHWARLYGDGAAIAGDDDKCQTPPTVMNRAVFTAALTGTVTRSVGTALLETLRIPDPGQVLDDHTACYPPEDDKTGMALEPLHPDRLAEDFLALTMPGHQGDYPAQSWADATTTTVLARPRDENAPASWTPRAVTFLASAAHRWPHLGSGYLYPRLRRDPQLAVDAGSAALSLIASLPTITPQILAAIEARLPDGPDVDLAVGIAAVTKRLADHRLATRNPATRARILHDLARALLWAGRYQEALTAAEESLSLTRLLFLANPVLQQANLVAALQTFGVITSELGRDEEARAASDEAAEIMRMRAEAGSVDEKWRRAAAAGRAAVSPSGEAGSPHSSLAARVWGMAWSFADEAPLYLRRRTRGTLIAGIRDIFNVGPEEAENATLADALSNQVNDLRDAGQYKEALALAQQAVAIWRRPGLAGHSGQQPGLATALTNLDVMLSAVGQEAEGLAAAKEAVAIWRRLIQLDQARYEPELALALSNLANRLGEVGHHEEATAMAEEAVAMGRRLAKANPAAYQPELARYLATLGMKLDEAGRLPEAIAAYEESVQILRRLAQDTPARFEWRLAAGLAFLAQCLSKRDEPDRVVAVIDEAIAIDPEPAALLSTRADAYVELDRHEDALADLTRAMDLDPELAAEILAKRGEIFRLLGRYEEALIDLDRATELDPQDATALGSRGAAYFGLDRHEDALADLDRAIEIIPEYAFALAIRGEVYLLLDRHEDALADLTGAIKINPQHAEALAMRGAAYLVVDRHEDALTDLDRAIGLDTGYRALAFWARGATYLALNRRDEAVADLSQAIEIDPEYASALQARGEAYRLLGRYEEALIDLDRATELDPQDATALASRGETYLALDRSEEALGDLDRAVAIDPQQERALAARGEVYLALDRYDDALADLDRAIGIVPEYAFALAIRGEVYLALDRHEEAVADLTRAIELDPELTWAIADRGKTYRLMGRHEEAVADLTRAIELDPELTWVIADRGETYRLMGRHEEAVADLTRAIELDPEYAWAIDERGEIYRLMGRDEEAIVDFTRLTELRPNRMEPFADRGETYRQMGLYEEAFADLNRAIELDPESAWAIGTRGQVYQANGRYEEAVADLTRTIELSPEWGEVIGTREQVYQAMGRYEEAVADLTRAIELDSNWRGPSPSGMRPTG